MYVLIHLCYRENEQNRIKNMILQYYEYAIAVW